MTRLPATFVRTSLVFLVVGFGIGAWMLAGRALDLPQPPGLVLVHVHFLMVGFFTCMVMGVALWMFPAPPGQGRAGIAASEPWGWAAYWLLVNGLILRAVSDLSPGLGAVPLGRAIILAAAAAQVAAAACFAVAVWRRTHPRPWGLPPGRGRGEGGSDTIKQ